MTTCKILILALTLSASFSLFAQDSTSQKRFTVVDVSAAFGGNFYLNYIDYNPGFKVHVGHGIKLNKNVAASLHAGLEFFEEERLLPLYLRISYQFRKQALSLDLGYNFFWLTYEDALEEYTYVGGPMVDLGYRLQIFKLGNLNIGPFVSYSFRRMKVKFLPRDIQGQLTSTLNLNHLTTGIYVSL